MIRSAIRRALPARDARPRRAACHAPGDRRLVALGMMLADGADALYAGRSTSRDAAGAMLAAAADILAIAYGYGAALEVPIGARLPRHAAETIARAAGDVVTVTGGNHGQP